MKTFKEMGLSPSMLKIIEELKFSEPTEIQEKAIPLALAGKDIIGESATGSGKTLVFGAIIVEKVKRGKGLQALIITPTRELAQQDSKFLSIFSKYSPLKILPVYGGVSLEPQIRELRTAEVVVGTPGRILDHLSRGTIDLSKVCFLVLDEADRMLDMGFIYDVTKIVDNCPKERQSFLFSATISSDIAIIAKRYMKNPVEVSAESYIDSSKLEQIFYDVDQKEKFSLLVHLLKREHSKLVMVFCNTKRNADFIGRNLIRYGFDALALHGDLSQNQRSRVMEHFHKSEKFILVCTDVAARGLDIKNVSHVYNYDSPKTSIEYIHRIGRTARAGKNGKAISILAQRDYENFRRVCKDSSLDIKQVALPEFEKVFVRMSEGRRDFGRSFRRDFRTGHKGFGRGIGSLGRREYVDRRENRGFGSKIRTGKRGEYHGKTEQRKFGSRFESERGEHNGRGEKTSFGSRSGSRGTRRFDSRRTTSRNFHGRKSFR